MTQSVIKIVDMIDQLLADPEKMGAVVDVAMKSEELSEDVRKLWFKLLMVHGEDVATAIENVDEKRKQIQLAAERRKEKSEKEFKQIFNQIHDESFSKKKYAKRYDGFGYDKYGYKKKLKTVDQAAFLNALKEYLEEN